MQTSHMTSLIQQLRKSALLCDSTERSDAELLGAFLESRDQAAFEILVRRHGPMVLGVCRRVLGNVQDAEDAFQATFLVLVRKAGSIVPREALGNWLYGVAHRTSLAARRRNLQRGSKEKQVQDMPHPHAASVVAWEELQPILDQELSALPDKYRLPLVLCDLEGRTRREVARELKIPDGTLSNRLATARKMLAKQLVRHGVALSGGAIATMLSQNGASASVPATLLGNTVTAAAWMTAGTTFGTAVVSAKVAALTEGIVKAMFMTKLKKALAVVLVLWLVALCGSWLAQHTVDAQANRIENLEAILQNDKPKTDLEKLHGTWTLTEMQTRGKKLAGKDMVYEDAPLKSLKLVIDSQKIPKLRSIPADQATDPNDRLGGVEFHFNNSPPGKGDFRLNETRSPRDLTMAAFLLYWESIYKLEGDTLSICFNPKNCIRPDDFRTSPDSDRVLFVFRRVSKDQGPKDAKKQEPTIKPGDILRLLVTGVVEPKAKEILDRDRLVQPDGTIGLDSFGSIYLAEQTTEQAGVALENHLAGRRLPRIKVRVSIKNREKAMEEREDDDAIKPVTNGIGMKFVWIPPGTFMMGSPKNEKDRRDDETQHEVTLTKGFYMGTYVITQDQWKSVMGSDPSDFKRELWLAVMGHDEKDVPDRKGANSLPVESVSWDDCQDFIKKLRKIDNKAYRLPTEAEWEYACRAGNVGRFGFGDADTDLHKHAWCDLGMGWKSRTQPVGRKLPNRWGLFDMHGNVSQWCQDWYREGYYKQGPMQDPIGPATGKERVLRGGAFWYGPPNCRSAFRGANLPDARHQDVGIRLCFFPER